MKFQKIAPKKVSDEIYDQLKSMIFSGGLVPGEKLPAERELAKNMGVSRPSLREALHKLNAQGFLEQIPGEGAYVKSITGESINIAIDKFIQKDGAILDLIEIRKILEVWSAKSAANRATDAEIDTISKYLEEMRGAKDKREIGHIADVNFHSSISYASHNVLLIHIMNNIYEWIEKVSYEVRSRLYTDKSGHEDLFHQHERIYQAIKNKDEKQAAESMQFHMEYIENKLRKIF